MASVACILCKSDLTSGTMLSKRRKIHGAVCKVALGILDELSESRFNGKVSSVSRDEFICHKCKNKAEELETLRKKVDSVTKELNDLVSGLMMAECQSQSVEVTHEIVEPTVPPSNKKRKKCGDEKEDIVSVSEHTTILYLY